MTANYSLFLLLENGFVVAVQQTRRQKDLHRMLGAFCACVPRRAANFIYFFGLHGRVIRVASHTNEAWSNNNRGIV